MNLQETTQHIKDNSFLIEIYGLGYVGFPLAVRLSKSGKKVIGIDVNENRINRLEKNDLLDSEIYLESEFREVRENGNLELNSNPNKSNIPKIGIFVYQLPFQMRK